MSNLNQAWRMAYQENRYMKDLEDHILIDRFNVLFGNSLKIIDNGKISLRSLKDPVGRILMQEFTDLDEEMRLRGLKRELLRIKDSHSPKPMIEYARFLSEMSALLNEKPIHLVKFGSYEYLSKNSFRITLASKYKDSSLLKSQADNEMAITFHGKPTITAEHGQPIEVIGTASLTYETSRPFYIFCTSLQYEPRLFGDFSADACLLIYDSVQFAADLIGAVQDKVELIDSAYKPVTYYNPIRGFLRERPEIEFSKTDKYLYQMEYRHVFYPKKSSGLPENIIVEIPNARNYSRLARLQKS